MDLFLQTEVGCKEMTFSDFQFKYHSDSRVHTRVIGIKLESPGKQHNVEENGMLEFQDNDM